MPWGTHDASLFLLFLEVGFWKVSYFSDGLENFIIPIHKCGFVSFSQSYLSLLLLLFLFKSASICSRIQCQGAAQLRGMNLWSFSFASSWYQCTSYRLNPSTFSRLSLQIHSGLFLKRKEKSKWKARKLIHTDAEWRQPRAVWLCSVWVCVIVFSVGVVSGQRWCQCSSVQEQFWLWLLPCGGSLISFLAFFLFR